MTLWESAVLMLEWLPQAGWEVWVALAMIYAAGAGAAWMGWEIGKPRD